MKPNKNLSKRIISLSSLVALGAVPMLAAQGEAVAAGMQIFMKTYEVPAGAVQDGDTVQLETVLYNATQGTREVVTEECTAVVPTNSCESPSLECVQTNSPRGGQTILLKSL